MARWRTLFRMLAIQRVLVKYGLDDVIKETHLWRPLRFLFYLAPRRRDRSAPLGERIRLALEELGPIFVKFGQAISTRRDLLPPDIADELAKLQDAVPPFPVELAIATLDEAYGEPVANVFERFDKEPLAAASIAQVHTAKLKSGHEVIVKVLRPGVLEQIERDLAVLRMLAGLADRYWEHGKRLRPLEVVDEYEHTILDELDLMREAANTAQLKRNFQGSDMLYVPDVYWDFCRPEVLVQERIYGTPISDMDTLREAGTNIRMLAENGVEIFFTQKTSVTWPKISWRSSIVTTTALPSCILIRAGYRPARELTSLNLLCARSASRFSTSPSRKSPSRRFSCGYSGLRNALTSRSSRR